MHCSGLENCVHAQSAETVHTSWLRESSLEAAFAARDCCISSQVHVCVLLVFISVCDSPTTRHEKLPRAATMLPVHFLNNPIKPLTILLIFVVHTVFFLDRPGIAWFCHIRRKNHFLSLFCGQTTHLEWVTAPSQCNTFPYFKSQLKTHYFCQHMDK